MRASAIQNSGAAMAEITAGMVKELREKTDAPMMECKKALTEANGDMGKAEEILRVKLGNKATKAAGRVAAEGVVGVYVAGDGKLGENMSIRRFVRTQAQGKLAQYVHGGAKIGVLIDVVGGDDTLAKDLAMHVAASKPVALSKEQVPAELIEKERTIAAQKAAESGKPVNIVEKMVEGSVQKYLKEVTLLGQPFVKDDKQTVEQLLKGKDAGVAGFTLYVVGEGIEKKNTDFAAEVAAQA